MRQGNLHRDAFSPRLAHALRKVLAHTRPAAPTAVQDLHRLLQGRVGTGVLVREQQEGVTVCGNL